MFLKSVTVAPDGCRLVEARSMWMDSFMQSPPLDPPVADTAPCSPALTGYDEQHLITYLRILDAQFYGASWQEVAKVVLHIDPTAEPDRARRAWDSHLKRAIWLRDNGFQSLLRGGAPN
jgi:hypothetical protein